MGSCVSAEAVQAAAAEGVVEVAGAQWHDAIFNGVESSGPFGHVRGNGALVLTAHALHLTRCLPKRRFSVPYAAITAITEEDWFLSRRVWGRKHVVVAFTRDGHADRIAFYLPPRVQPQVIDAIRQHCGSTQSSQ
jgi:hypothetical protein